MAFAPPSAMGSASLPTATQHTPLSPHPTSPLPASTSSPLLDPSLLPFLDRHPHPSFVFGPILSSTEGSGRNPLVALPKPLYANAMGYFAAERDEAHVDNTLADYPESQRLKLRRESTARPRANPSRPEVAGGVGGEEAEQEGSKLILQCLDRYSLAVVVGLMSREETRWMKGENLEDEEGDKSRVDCRTPPPASTKSVRISIRPRPFDPYANASSKDTVFARLPGTSLEQQFHPTVIVIPSSTGRDTSRQDHDLTPSTSDASTPPRETSHRPSPAVMSSSPLETIHAPYTTVSRPSDPLNPLLFPAAAFPRPTHYLVLQLSPASFHTPCPTTFVNLSGELSLSESTIPRTHVSGQDYAQPPELVLEKRSPMDEAMDVYMDATATSTLR